MSLDSERRKQKRRKCAYYMQVVDANTLQLIGYLSDISLIGIKVDTGKPLPVNTNFKMRIDLTPDLANKTYLIFNGRSRWCEADKFEPNSFNVGFEVDILSREDTAIFQRMYNQYGMDLRQ